MFWLISFLSINSTQHRDKHGTLTESVIVGESANTGEPDEHDGQRFPRSFPIAKKS